MRKELHKILSAEIIEVGGRVYPLIQPQDTKHKCIVYHIIGTADTTGITCANPIDTAYGVQIDIFAPTYAESVDLLEHVSQVLRDNFITAQLMSYESYENITVKYRQAIVVDLKLKPVYTAPPLPINTITVNHGVPVVNHGVQVVV